MNLLKKTSDYLIKRFKLVLIALLKTIGIKMEPAITLGGDLDFDYSSSLKQVVQNITAIEMNALITSVPLTVNQKGLIVFCTDDNLFYVWIGDSWKSFSLPNGVSNTFLACDNNGKTYWCHNISSNANSNTKLNFEQTQVQLASTGTNSSTLITSGIVGTGMLETPFASLETNFAGTFASKVVSQSSATETSMGIQVNAMNVYTAIFDGFEPYSEFEQKVKLKIGSPEVGQVWTCTSTDGSGAWESLGSAAFLNYTAFIMADIGTTKGDIITFTGGGSPVRLGVGSDGQALLSDSSTPTGVKWGNVGGTSPLTTKGDLAGFSTTATRIPVGTDGKILMASSSSANGVDWVSLNATKGLSLVKDYTNKIATLSLVHTTSPQSGGDVSFDTDQLCVELEWVSLMFNIEAIPNDTHCIVYAHAQGISGNIPIQDINTNYTNQIITNLHLSTINDGSYYKIDCYHSTVNNNTYITIYPNDVMERI